MANGNAPRGLAPVRYLSGAPYNGAVNKYYVAAGDSTAIYPGGLVKFAGSADSTGIASVTGNVATGDAVVGVMISPAIDNVGPTDLTYRPGSTAGYILVCDDPDVLFEIQEDSVGGALAATAVGNVADLTGFTAGSTFTGSSSMQLDSSTATATGDGTQDVLIVGAVQRPDNEIGANAKWHVRLNNHAFVDGNTGA
ncbi:hypothetical protein [Loktanella sp. R86503]|uniref:hypothetical protein n=1 Tax=Loktanella sp. R86503 TaxID=3093847 RepID=UPI0036D78D93